MKPGSKKYNYMSSENCSYFVTAAVIAAKLDQATRAAQQLTLIASNAKALALRAGQGAAGFRPLTDFIHKLADVTVSSSKKIDLLATELSRMAAEKVRGDRAIAHFDTVYENAKDSPYIHSLDVVYKRTVEKQQDVVIAYRQQIDRLNEELDVLEKELRAAGILATLSRVEALQADSFYQDALNNVADNVESVAVSIKTHIKSSQSLVAELH